MRQAIVDKNGNKTPGPVVDVTQIQTTIADRGCTHQALAKWRSKGLAVQPDQCWQGSVPFEGQRNRLGQKNLNRLYPVSQAQGLEPFEDAISCPHTQAPRGVQSLRASSLWSRARSSTEFAHRRSSGQAHIIGLGGNHLRSLALAQQFPEA